MAVKATPLLGVLCLASCGVSELRLSITGRGLVAVGTSQCTNVCTIRLDKPTTLDATPEDGWRFARWGGDCAEETQCTVRGGERVEAFFELVPAIVIHVDGPGRVESSDGRTCASTCNWPTDAALTLTPRTLDGSSFIGFVGACEGTGPCQLAEGSVTAVFRTPDTIRVTFVGDGGGQVVAGARACVNSCLLAAPVGSSVTIVATPNDTSLPAVFGGACAANPCVVSSPAAVTVDFEAGRRVEITVTGAAKGQVLLNDALFCDAGICTSVLPSTASLAFTGTRADDYVSFRGFDGGGCQGVRACFIPPAPTPVRIEARFEPIVAMTRTFDARGQALWADDTGLALALAADQALDIDGISYATRPAASPTFPVLLETAWDGGIRWVIPLNEHDAADLNPLPSFESVARADDGDLYFGGNCYQGNVNGAVHCNGRPTPLIARVRSGRLTALATDPTFGTSSINFDSDATIIDITSLAGRMIGFRGVGAYGTVSGGLGFIEEDAGFTPVFTLPRVPHIGIPTPHRCVASGATLRCVFNYREPLMLDDCILPGGGPVLDDPVFLEFDSSLRCRRGLRVYGAGGQIAGVSSSDADGGLLVFGLGGPADFGNGVTTQPGTWLAEWVGSVVARAASVPAASSGGGGYSLVQAERGLESILLQFLVTPPGGGVTTFYGRAHTVPTVSITFLDPTDLRSPVRRWEFTDSSRVPDETIKTTRLHRVGDKIAIMVTGVNVHLGPIALSSDNRRRAHLLVLQE